MEKRGLPLKKQNKTKTNQTKKPINQNKTKKPNPPAKKKKPKIKEKIKNKNFSPQKKPPKQNSRVLLKTIPNKSEMKNKYKTKLKKYAFIRHQLFLADNIYSWKRSADYLYYPNQALRLLGAEAD